MTTLTIQPTPADLSRIQPGDRITHMDSHRLGRPRVVAGRYDQAYRRLPLVNDRPGSPVEDYVYPGGLVGSTLTVERDEPEPKPVPAPPTLFLHNRERKALRRNPQYEATLRLLDDGKGGAVDLRAVVDKVNFTDHPRYRSHQAGILATWYGWTERVADYTWRLTPAGRRVLAALDQRKKD